MRLWPEAEDEFSYFIPTASAAGLAVTICFTFLLLTAHICYQWLLAGTSILSLCMLILDRQSWNNRIAIWQKTTQIRIGTAAIEKISLGLLLLFACILLLLALLPPLNYDALEYHLAVPEAYLAHHGWMAMPLNVYAGFPMNIEILYLWGLGWNSLASTTVMHTLFALLSAIGCIGLARMANLKQPIWAAFLYLGAGLVQFQCIHANIDHGLTFFAVSAYMTCLARSRKTLGPFLLTGLFLGLALGSKYVAAISVALPCFVLWIGCAPYEIRRNIRVWICLLLVPFAVVLPWLIRNAWLYGNPVHPLLPGLFQYASWDPTSAAFFKATVSPKSYDWIERFVIFIIGLRKWTLGFPMTGEFGAGGWLLWMSQGHIGFLGILALAIRPHELNRNIWVLVSAAGISILAWVFLTQSADRFLLPVLPLIAIPAATGLERLPRRLGALPVYFGTASIAVLFFLSTFNSLHPMPFYLGQQDGREFLSQHLPHFRAIQFLNGLSRKQDLNVLFVGEAQATGAQFPHIVTVVYNQNPLLDYDDQGNVIPPSTLGLHNRLQELGITHILYNSSELERLIGGYEPLGWQQGRYLRGAIADLEKEKAITPIPTRAWRGHPAITIFAVALPVSTDSPSILNVP